MRGVATVVVLVVLVAVLVGASLVVYYLNSQRAMSGDLVKDIITLDYSSYSNSYDQPTTVRIAGVTAHVNWDEKALAAVGYSGKRFKILGVVTYWHTVNFGMATKSNIPWGFWPATCYKAEITWHTHVEPVVDTKHTKIRVSLDTWNSLGPSLRSVLEQHATRIGEEIEINMPVQLRHLFALADVAFKKAERPWFGSCNNWQTERVDTLLIDTDVTTS